MRYFEKGSCFILIKIYFVRVSACRCERVSACRCVRVSACRCVCISTCRRVHVTVCACLGV